MLSDPVDFDVGIPGAFALPAEEVSANEIIGGLQQLIERAHEKKLMIFGGTLTPFEGTTFPGYYYPRGGNEAPVGQRMDTHEGQFRCSH